MYKMYKIEVYNKNELFDAAAENLKKDIIDIRIKSVRKVKVSYVYLIDGKLSKKSLESICKNLLIDPVTQNYRISNVGTDLKVSPSKEFQLEVYFKSGVTDSVGEAVKIGISDLNINTINSVKTGMKYYISGVTQKEVKTICEKLLANKLIQYYKII